MLSCSIRVLSNAKWTGIKPTNKIENYLKNPRRQLLKIVDAIYALRKKLAYWNTKTLDNYWIKDIN